MLHYINIGQNLTKLWLLWLEHNTNLLHMPTVRRWSKWTAAMSVGGTSSYWSYTLHGPL